MVAKKEVAKTSGKEEALREERLAKLQEEANLMLFKAEEVAAIKTVEDEQRAVEFVSQIKLRIKVANKDLDSWTDPLKDMVKRFKEKYNLTTNPLEQAEKIIRAGMIAFRNAEDFRIKEEQRKEAELIAMRAKHHLMVSNDPNALEKVNEAGADLTAARAAAPKAVPTQSGTAHFVKTWKGEIVDYTRLPDWFIKNVMELAKEKGLYDQVMRAYIKAGHREIDGIKIEAESTPRISA